jgi:HTH-type transcriptional regulator / antitoxin HigA
MPESRRNEYTPDIVTPPGETLLEVLEARGMTQVELAERMGRPKKTISELINGKIELTPQTALQLERVLGVPASFWSNLERHYREYLARQQEREKLEEQRDWPAHFPIGLMAKLGWINRKSDQADQTRELLTFFGVSSVQQWRTCYEGEAVKYRLARTFEPDIYALTAWLRQGERQAHAVDCQPFDLASFRSALVEVRALTLEAEPRVFMPTLETIGARCGVAIVFVRELPHSRACGATRWLSPNKALIQLSLRYKTNDHLWFTFFHEAGHIVLHGKRDMFVELDGRAGPTEQESDANRFAGDFLIPPEHYDTLLASKPFSTASVNAFATAIGVAPGIVVGRLQHDRQLPFANLNSLKVRYHWAHETD